MSYATTTSRRRLGYCSAIVRRVIAYQDRDWTTWLADELADRSFEDRTDAELHELAEQAKVADLDRIAALDGSRFDVTETFFCHQCLDQQWIEVTPGRYGRCQNCNRVEEPQEDHHEPDPDDHA